ncbi:hypothetical protein F5Y08DRAFT_324258 [Xylaria arbuscula]|nr:hypothetical protein F5Y08DRAFT_324258 [Xylaria arbuscula]
MAQTRAQTAAKRGRHPDEDRDSPTRKRRCPKMTQGKDQNSAAKDTLIPQPTAVLGIDLRGTGVQPTLAISNQRGLYHVVNATPSDRSVPFDDSKYQSTVHVFNCLHQTYNGNIVAPARARLTAAICLPFLTGEKPISELWQEYAPVLRCQCMLNEASIRESAEEDIKEIFRAISRDANRLLRRISRCRTLKAIGLSIPAHWTTQVRDKYKSIIAEVFGNFVQDIILLTDIDALFHFLYRELPEGFTPLYENGDKNIALVMDFRGYEMNASIIDVISSPQHNDQTGQDPYAASYRLKKSEGASGGYEQWEHNIVEACIQMLLDEGHIQSYDDVKPEERRRLHTDLNRFNRYDTNACYWFNFRVQGSNYAEGFCLQPDKICDAYTKAFEAVYQKADSMIKEALELSDGTARFLITGAFNESCFVKEKLMENYKHILEKNWISLYEYGIIGVETVMSKGAMYYCRSTLRRGV